MIWLLVEGCVVKDSNLVIVECGWWLLDGGVLVFELVWW